MVDEEDRPELEWWKCKKWALHILERFIYRYGNPSNTEKSYRQFAQYYGKTFNGMWRSFYGHSCILPHTHHHTHTACVCVRERLSLTECACVSMCYSWCDQCTTEAAGCKETRPVCVPASSADHLQLPNRSVRATPTNIQPFTICSFHDAIYHMLHVFPFDLTIEVPLPKVFS